MLFYGRWIRLFQVKELEDGLLQLLVASEDCANFSSALQSVGHVYQPGEELTDFKKLFDDEITKSKANSSSIPPNHPLLRQFREAIWSLGAEKDGLDIIQSDEDIEMIGQSLPFNPNAADSKDSVIEGSLSRDFMVQGQRKDLNTIFLKLRIADSTGHIRNIHFPFDTEVDTALIVASEMVEELDLTDHDVSVIAAMVDSEIRAYIPDWTPTELSGVNVDSEVAISDSSAFEGKPA